MRLLQWPQQQLTAITETDPGVTEPDPGATKPDSSVNASDPSVNASDLPVTTSDPAVITEPLLRSLRRICNDRLSLQDLLQMSRVGLRTKPF